MPEPTPMTPVPDDLYRLVEKVAELANTVALDAEKLFAAIRKQGECGKPHPWRGLEYRCIRPDGHDGKHRRLDDGRFTDADVALRWGSIT